MAGEVRPPGDKSISHRCALFALMANGHSEITGISKGGDVNSTLGLVEALGGVVSEINGRVVIDSKGIREPRKILEVGNSGTLLRLATGMLAGYQGHFVLSGDESVNSRPMDRIIDPLTLMGAKISGRSGNKLAPIAIRGASLSGREFQGLPASAQVKSAILLAGLRADSPTTVIEHIPTRPHTEEMLKEVGVDVDIVDQVGSTRITVHPNPSLLAKSWKVPTDPSQAAFFIVGALISEKSEVLIKDVLIDKTRIGFLEVLKRMGADVELRMQSDSVADIYASSSSLRATDIGGDEIPSVIDELPILAIAAARAEGTSRITGAGELRIKESDRIATSLGMLSAFGVDAIELQDGMVITGSDRPFRPGIVETKFDHRIAMSAAIGSSVSTGEVEIRDASSVDTSYPGFLSVLLDLAE